MISTDLSKDSINKTYKSCGCIYVSELDIIDNIINEKYIQICKIHLNSQRNSLINYSKNNDIPTSPASPEFYLNFGKYKNKSFSYVFHIDKLYCYNLAFWNNTLNQHSINNINCKNTDVNKGININQFINYIKQQISL